MYSGDTDSAMPDVAEALREAIISEIWSKGAIVLVIEWANWAQSGQP
jgi:hypothetical protein